MHYADITDAISDLVIANVTVKDIDETPDSGADVRGGNSLLMLDPTAPITDLTTEAQSLGLESTRYRTYSYTINYWLLYCNAGETRGLKDILPGLVARATAVMEAIAELEPSTVSLGGCTLNPIVRQCTTLQDAANNSYHGALIAVQVTEFGEV